MAASELIAGLIGPVFVAFGALIVFRYGEFERVIADFTDNPGLIVLAGIPTLVAGLAIVRAHNLWVADWRVIVTILGWLSIVGGVFRILWPTLAGEMAKRLLANRALVTFVGGVELVLGALLSVLAYAGGN